MWHVFRGRIKVVFPPSFTSLPPQIHHQKTTICTTFFAKNPHKNTPPPIARSTSAELPAGLRLRPDDLQPSASLAFSAVSELQVKDGGGIDQLSKSKIIWLAMKSSCLYSRCTWKLVKKSHSEQIARLGKHEAAAKPHDPARKH